MNQINYYKELFTKTKKEDVFELNIDFIHDVIDTKAKIEELGKLPQIITHPTNKKIQKISEPAKQIVKLKQLYANQISVLNKLIGNESTPGASGDPINNFKKKHGIKNE